MKKLGIICMVLGVALLFGAAALIFYNNNEEQAAEKTSEEYLEKVKSHIMEAVKSKSEDSSAVSPSGEISVGDESSNGETADNEGSNSQTNHESTDNEVIPEDVHRGDNSYVGNMLVAEIEGFKFVGYITIPKLGIQLPVLSETDMDGMKSFPCRFYGSPKTNNLVVGAHNYSVHFGNISDLSAGDTVTFHDMEGNLWQYSAVFSEVLDPEDGEMLASGEYPLTIYTCNYDGSQRIAVRCEIAQ